MFIAIVIRVFYIQVIDYNKLNNLFNNKILNNENNFKILVSN